LLGFSADDILNICPDSLGVKVVDLFGPDLEIDREDLFILKLEVCGRDGEVSINNGKISDLDIRIVGLVNCSRVSKLVVGIEEFGNLLRFNSNLNSTGLSHFTVGSFNKLVIIKISRNIPV